jgi:glycosyltransferase involved in cell wall biosynthesis
MPEVRDGGPVDLSVVLPCFNEEEAIGQVISEVRDGLSSWPGRYEILVVDDASSDRSADVAASAGVRVVRRVENGGSGSARKTGVLEAKGGIIAMLDADGTYDAGALPEILSHLPAYDQVNGARTSEQGTMKPIRIVAKWSIRKLAEWISGKKIPDLNTGLKAFKRDVMLRYLWVLPEGFSCVTSMSLAFLCNGHPVKYVPVAYKKRIGVSKFHPVHDTARYASTMLRMIMYFRPLRVFFPLAVGIGVLAGFKSLYDVFVSPRHTLQESDIILALAALMTLVIGLLADLIVAQRRGGA